MRYIAIIDADKFSNFKCFEDADGKYLVAKDANAEIDEWLPLHFTEIPDNATNLDVLKIMFPDYIPNDFTWILCGDGDDWNRPKGYYGNWWNAPYQKGGKTEYLGGELYDGEFENR